jgi:hypothetical protein
MMKEENEVVSILGGNPILVNFEGRVDCLERNSRSDCRDETLEE